MTWRKSKIELGSIQSNCNKTESLEEKKSSEITHKMYEDIIIAYTRDASMEHFSVNSKHYGHKNANNSIKTNNIQ